MKFSSFLLLFFNVTIFAQTGFEIPNYAAKTPEAAAFLRSGEYPVDLSTGVPGISIPLYTIDAKGFEIPIALNYHASGIKVNQEASWVGLGWNLNFGAQIILSVRDDVDENNSQIDNLPSEETLNYYDAHPYQFSGGVILSQELAKSRIRDVYMFSSPTASGQFYKDNNTWVVYPPEAFTVNDYSQEENHLHTVPGTKFKIVDAEGNIYFFKTSEISYRVDTHHDFYTSAWYVDKIITSTREIVNFNYEDDGVLEDISFTESATVKTEGKNCGCPTATESTSVSPIMTRNGSTFTYSKKIKEISYNGGLSRVVFNRLNDRQDLRSGVYSVAKNYSRSRLFTVIAEHRPNVSSVFSYIKGYELVPDYFNPTASGTNAFRMKRLKLHQVATLIEGDTHEFTYSNVALPSKDSRSQDYYGYYNGMNNINMVPATQINIPYQVTVGNGVRSVVEDKVKAGILTEIHFPSKGYTKFSYESNNYFKFEGYRNVGVSVDADSYGYHPGTSNVLSYPVTFVAENVSDAVVATVTWSVTHNVPQQTHLLHQQYIKIKVYKINLEEGDYLIYESSPHNAQNVPSASQQFTESFEMAGPGSYKLVIESMGSNVKGHANLTYFKSVYTVENPLAAGLRISTIENHEADATLLTLKKYSYNDPENINLSSGKLINGGLGFNFISATFKLFHPPFVCTQTVGGALIPAIDYTHTYQISSDAQYGVDGNAVVYKFVKESNISIDSLASSNGYTLYQFTTESDMVLTPSVIVSTPWKRGKLRIKSDYKVVNNIDYILRKEENNYVEDNSKIANIRGFKMRQFASASFSENPAGPFLTPYNMIGLDGCGIPGNVNSTLQFLPFNMIAAWYYLKNTTLSEFFYSSSNMLAGTLTTSKTFNYNNSVHLQLSSIYENTSNGDQLETRYYYPHDAQCSTYPSVDDMKNRHMLSKPLITETFRNNEKLSGTYTFYKDWDPDATDVVKMLLPEIVKTVKGSNITETRLMYNRIDGLNGNVLELQQENGIPISYIWGYNNMYPIAKLINVKYDLIPSNLIDGLKLAVQSGVMQNIDAASSSLRTHFTNGMVTVFSYLPLIGVDTIIDERGSSTTYEYDSQGRLKRIKDDLGNILKESDYHYKN